VCLNGDIDNYQTLKQEDEQETGRAMPEAITTDTKIIPLRMQLYLQRGKSVDDAFRLAVNDFEGAHAIAKPLFCPADAGKSYRQVYASPVSLNRCLSGSTNGGRSLWTVSHTMCGSTEK
jgi:hypothetical protein